MKFNVRNSDGVRFPYTLDLGKTTVGSLKAMVARDSGVASEEQRLYCGGMEMEDYRMLSFYGLYILLLITSYKYMICSIIYIHVYMYMHVYLSLLLGRPVHACSNI